MRKLQTLLVAKHTLCRECFIELIAHESTPYIVNERYLLRQAVHRSAASALYEAEDQTNQTLVALKIIRASALADPRALDRLLTEAKLASSFRHGAVAGLLDFGTLPDASAYLVSEFAHGLSLRNELKRLSKFPVPQAIQLLSALGDALDAAHVAGLIHRDLKPESIILAADWTTKLTVSADVQDREWPLRIVSFNLARVAMGKQFVPGTTHVMQSRGQLPLRPTYMSPEQFRGIETDFRTDIFSLGVIAYEMLAGEPPLSAKKFGDFGDKILAKPPVPLHVINPAINPLLESTVLRAMQKLPERRQQRARQFNQELLSAFAS
jgi:eukaryotic-like serine/threonine-protein kinase